MTPADKGKSLYYAKNCVSCHSVNGTRIVGPSFKGIWDTEVRYTIAGSSEVKSAKVDADYLRESIENPTAKLVEGFPPSMPPYKGVLSDDEITNLVEYIKSLK